MTLARQSSSRSRSSTAPTLKNRSLRAAPASAALSSASAGRSTITSETPRSASAIVAAAASVPPSESDIFQRELLIKAPPRRVVVVDGEPRTRHSIIGGWHLDQRQGRLRVRAAQIADVDLGSIGGSRHPREQESPG